MSDHITAIYRCLNPTHDDALKLDGHLLLMECGLDDAHRRSDDQILLDDAYFDTENTIPLIDIRGPYCPTADKRPQGFIDEPFYPGLRVPELISRGELDSITAHLAEIVLRLHDRPYGISLDRGGLFDAFLSPRLSPKITAADRLVWLKAQFSPIVHGAKYISINLTEHCPAGKDLKTGSEQVQALLEHTEADIILSTGTPAFPILYDRQIVGAAAYHEPVNIMSRYLGLDAPQRSRLWVEIPESAIDDDHLDPSEYSFNTVIRAPTRRSEAVEISK